MRRAPFIAIVCCALTAGGCSKRTAKKTESAAGEVASRAPAASRLMIADVTGKWNVKATPEWNSPLITHLVLTATRDPANWTITYGSNPKPIPVRGVMFSGDSLVFDWGPYNSARRAGMKAVSHDTYRLRDGKLVGRSVSHYLGTLADSVVRLRLEGTRAP